MAGGEFINDQHRIPAFDLIQRRENRIAADVVAVLQHPLNLADPHRHPRQFGGVGIEFDAQHIARAGLDAQLSVQSQRLRVEIGPMLQILQRPQRQIQEIA